MDHLIYVTACWVLRVLQPLSCQVDVDYLAFIHTNAWLVLFRASDLMLVLRQFSASIEYLPFSNNLIQRFSNR